MSSKPIDRPISKADLEFYYGGLVLATAQAFAEVCEYDWEKLAYKSKQRYLNRAVKVLCAVLNRTDVVDLLPALAKNLKTRE